MDAEHQEDRTRDRYRFVTKYVVALRKKLDVEIHSPLHPEKSNVTWQGSLHLQ